MIFTKPWILPEHMMRRSWCNWVLIVLSLALPSTGQSQSRKGVGLTFANHTGSILKHSNELTFTPPPVTSGFEVSLTRRSYGKKDWEAWTNYPVFGINAIWLNLGSKQLGHAFAIYPFVDVPLFQRESLRAYAQIGSGLAWLTQHYDRIHNPQFNAIGSNLNNSAAVRIHADYRITPHWWLTGGFSFTHFSNGQAQAPNYGINVVGGMIGMQWIPKPLDKTDFLPAKEPNIPDKRWGISANINLAFREYFAFGGPRYPVYIGGVSGLYQFSRTNRFYAGLEYEFNKGIYTFSKLNWQFEGDNARRWAASRLMVFIADEFMFGNWSMMVQSGTYVGGFGFLIPFPVYNKLALRYYLPYVPKTRARVFGVLTLKSHIITAEYISLGMGVTFD